MLTGFELIHNMHFILSIRAFDIPCELYDRVNNTSVIKHLADLDISLGIDFL